MCYTPNGYQKLEGIHKYAGPTPVIQSFNSRLYSSELNSTTNKHKGVRTKQVFRSFPSGEKCVKMIIYSDHMYITVTGKYLQSPDVGPVLFYA